jgi:hypothetical protein
MFGGMLVGWSEQLRESRVVKLNKGEPGPN